MIYSVYLLQQVGVYVPLFFTQRFWVFISGVVAIFKQVFNFERWILHYNQVLCDCAMVVSMNGCLRSRLVYKPMYLNCCLPVIVSVGTIFRLWYRLWFSRLVIYELKTEIFYFLINQFTGIKMHRLRNKKKENVRPTNKHIMIKTLNQVNKIN